MPFGIGHPPPTHQLQSTCVGEGSRVPNLQTEFNYLDSFKSYGIFSDFVVPIVPTSSLCHPRHPHIVPIAPRRALCGPHGRCLCGLHPMLSPSSPCHPCHPHVIPVSSPCCPHSPQKPWSPWSPPHVVSVVPVFPTSSPCHLEGPHIIPNPQIPTPPTPTPWGLGGLESVKMQ